MIYKLQQRLLTRNLLSKHWDSAGRWSSASFNFRSATSDSAAYEGDGKTTVTVLNNQDARINFINAYSRGGFRLANNLFVNGSILVFPTFVFSWNVFRAQDITPESLIIFDLIVPKIKILVIGYGSPEDKIDGRIPAHLRSRGISCEILPTHNAVTTYNFLLDDAVHVAGAFIPTNAQNALGQGIKTNIDNTDPFPERNIQYTGPGYQLPIHKKILQRDAGKEKFDE